MNFLYIKSRENISNLTPLILDTFSESLNIVKFKELNSNVLIIYYDYFNTEIKDITNILINDLYIDVKIYNSIKYSNVNKIDNYINIVSKIFNNYYFKDSYIDNKTILKNDFIIIDEDTKKLIFSSYYNNSLMYQTIKTFLENNQNISETAKVLYLHRNTLTQRLDKFVLETNFNVKEFIDGFLIYKLLK